jgi:signal transduction histidine kinase/DNA-binding response OmpR family regulator
MSADVVLTVALDILYLGVAGLTLLDYFRRPSPVRRAVAAVFGSLAVTFAVQVARALVPSLPAALSTWSSVFLLAQPVLVLWLIGHFRPVSRRLLGAAVALYITSTALLLLGGSGNRLGVLAVVAYFVGVEAVGAALFGLEARRRAGASRTRLITAGVATGLFGVAILAAGASAAAAPGGTASQVVIATARLLALVAALGYLAAFAPPRQLRNLSQQAIAYRFMRDLGQLPSGTPPEQIWELLVRAARSITGARGAAVLTPSALGDAVVATAGEWPTDRSVNPTGSVDLTDRGQGNGSPLLSLPIETDGQQVGSLVMAVSGNPLFVEDDIELLRLLAVRCALSVERERVLRELQHASEAKSDFLAAMSHELRTPLNAIIGFSELLERAPDGGHDAPTVARYTEHIHSSGLHLLDLVNDVLDLAKVEAGRLDLHLTRFDLRALVVQTAETMRPLAERKRISLELPGSEAVEIEADPNRIRQVVYNLLSNAVKFTPDDGVVSVGLDIETDRVRLTVADTGPGITTADQARVFEAFQQVQVTDAQRQEGTGLGLALTRQLVERHGGKVELASEVGRGSRFTIELPVAPPRAPSVEAAKPQMPFGVPLVLVIEDDPRAAELLRVYLTEALYAVRVAADGRSGFEQASSLQPAAIVLDILLPDIDGWEVLQRLKGSAVTRDIPVLVVSVIDDAQLGLALGAVDYFVKPVARESLLMALGRLTFTTKVRQRNVSVLAIDADPDATERYRGILGEDGFVISGAETGLKGLELAQAALPDLILLDLILPDVDGFEVVSRLKADPTTADIPIWVATRGTLSPQEKARLNGKVLGIVERGDGAMTALRHWLDRVAAPEHGGGV